MENGERDRKKRYFNGSMGIYKTYIHVGFVGFFVVAT